MNSLLAPYRTSGMMQLRGNFGENAYRLAEDILSPMSKNVNLRKYSFAMCRNTDLGSRGAIDLQDGSR
jgi:hypothetical protein